MALHTLEQMANGGINDHLGGGFSRYSVDQQWMIPHFEKMLYDNGQLLALYAEAWLASDRRPLFRHTCEHTAEWVIREMQSPLGGYYASLDADSEGEEGRFYVWDPSEATKVLNEWNLMFSSSTTLHDSARLRKTQRSLLQIATWGSWQRCRTTTISQNVNSVLR